ncbi:hypothetical protein C2E20_0444 [Micractinium conductrix]|uniref:BAH domain-containing protein n=1 Tax=Micractinium conductrix TaxID=554055 RepID=A0A2P6VQJ2_9CHLO|nr:hypothetical protein C2E20_0444 [Micractinium conductrix]|eukprot:PSC76373.1 hypothetical protein C2E20_0444 [Micractinium conductrix]
MSADGVDAAGDSSSDWEDEPLRAKRSRALAAADEQSSDSDLSDGSDAEEDDGFGEEPSRTDDEQDEKLIEAVPFERGDEAREDVNALKAVVIQDMKTEDSSVPGGYALPCVTRGSVVLVRGADDAGATVTWVAEVRKIYRAGGSKLKADIRWFYRRSDVPEKAARRLVLVDEARELVYTNDEHTVDVRFIRHPAQAWFLSAGDAAPRMRCSEGGTRHTRHRPGFLIRYAYDAGSKKLHAIGSKALLEKSPELAREVGLRVKRSREELARLEADEAARDAAAGLSGVEAPPRAPPAGGDDDDEEEQEEEEEEVEEQEGHEGTSSDDDEPILGRPGQAGAAAAAAGNGVAGAAVAAEGGAAPTAAHQRQQREQEAAGEARRQEAAVQRAEEQQRRQEDQRRRQQQELDDDAVHLAQLLPQAAGPAAASSANSQQQQQQQQQSPPSAAAGGWRRCVQKLMRSGGELPKRAAPEAPPKGGRPQPGSQLSEDAVAAKVAAALRPGLPHMAAALRAVCAATEAAMRELDCLNILRLLYVWLWHLADELHAGGRAPELVECAELALRALKRCACWSAAHLAWLRMVHGSNLLNMLAAEEAAEQFTPGVQRAARDLKAAWSAQLEQKRGEAAARRARQQGEAKRDRQEQRLLLQQSPQAAKGQSLALSGRRLSALGAGGATYPGWRPLLLHCVTRKQNG